VIEVQGKGGITAKVIADSMANGVRLTTLQLTYPRFIHAEFLTHRQFSRNSSSSRAIPVEKTLAQVYDSPAMPIHWGQNQPGMQAREEVEDTTEAHRIWVAAADMAGRFAKGLRDHGLHKQVVNRVLEPYQFMHTLVTATEWDNFFELRLHRDAQPEICELAKVMAEAMERNNHIQHLRPWQWHLPYVSNYDLDGNLSWSDDPTTAIKSSVARCARVSYLNHDQTEPDVEKDIALADKLAEAGHWSPFEHQATPMRYARDIFSDIGQTHMTRDGWLWSGNLRGWVQNRQMLNR